jgi:hypothetical protein
MTTTIHQKMDNYKRQSCSDYYNRTNCNKLHFVAFPLYIKSDCNTVLSAFSMHQQIDVFKMANRHVCACAASLHTTKYLADNDLVFVKGVYPFSYTTDREKFNEDPHTNMPWSWTCTMNLQYVA